VTTQVAGRRCRLASPRTASVLAALVVVLIAVLPIVGTVSGHMSSTSATAASRDWARWPSLSAGCSRS
jgi:hypothetical protein